MKAELSIQETGWSGLNGGSSTKEKPRQVEASENEQIPLGEHAGHSTLQVKEVGERDVTLHAENLALREGGKPGINLRPEPTDVTLATGEAREFVTPTMDSGTSWDITLLSTKE